MHRREGTRAYFKAQTQSPVSRDLQQLFEKTAGLAPIHSTRQNGAYRLSLRPGKALGESANVGRELKRVRRYA
jgi:hypothetical protein